MRDYIINQVIERCKAIDENDDTFCDAQDGCPQCMANMLGEEYNKRLGVRINTNLDELGFICAPDNLEACCEDGCIEHIMNTLLDANFITHKDTKVRFKEQGTLEVNIGDDLSIRAQGTIITGKVHSASHYGNEGWFIELKEANTNCTYSYWKQYQDGGMIIGINGKGV